jgi:hypothetical protein
MCVPCIYSSYRRIAYHFVLIKSNPIHIRKFVYPFMHLYPSCSSFKASTPYILTPHPSHPPRLAATQHKTIPVAASHNILPTSHCVCLAALNYISTKNFLFRQEWNGIGLVWVGLVLVYDVAPCACDMVSTCGLRPLVVLFSMGRGGVAGCGSLRGAGKGTVVLGELGMVHELGWEN